MGKRDRSLYCSFRRVMNPPSTNSIAKTSPNIGVPVSCIPIVLPAPLGLAALMVTYAYPVSLSSVTEVNANPVPSSPRSVAVAKPFNV